MALLRNLRGILSDPEIDSSKVSDLANQLIKGVKNGKQFPFRYYSAYKVIKSETVGEHQSFVLDALNQCILESLDTMPKLTGYIHCLSDNSGSARGAFTSEYGKVGVYEIANLSSLLTAYLSTEGGSVWVFGDRLHEYKVDKARPLLDQLDEINELGNTVGQSTETGVWLFWEKAIKEKIHLDTVFIYSDMQCGRGELYASDEHAKHMQQLDCMFSDGSYYLHNNYIDVLSLVKTYREIVHRKVNLFSVQVAGYDNTVLPDLLYRGAILSGWTGKEAKLADAMIKVWDLIEGGK